MEFLVDKVDCWEAAMLKQLQARLEHCIQSTLTDQPEVAAFALVTDSGFSSVYAAWLSHELLEDEGEEILEIPFDWDHERHGDAFDSASTLLAECSAALPDRPDQEAFVVDLFERTLARAREENSSLRDSVLVICCADGGPGWRMLASAAQARLASS
ncbi:MAG: hypothetical protein VX899_12795 [Myxococcota bacterium]|nr:hypothetical protein [Myxococcota bacterium]